LAVTERGVITHKTRHRRDNGALAFTNEDATKEQVVKDWCSRKVEGSSCTRLGMRLWVSPIFHPGQHMTCLVRRRLWRVGNAVMRSGCCCLSKSRLLSEHAHE